MKHILIVLFIYLYMLLGQSSFDPQKLFAEGKFDQCKTIFRHFKKGTF
jgi:hypothetical protein